MFHLREKSSLSKHPFIRSLPLGVLTPAGFESGKALDYTASILTAEAMPNYTRLFADQDGESHFEDLEIDLQLTDYAPPAAPLGLSSFTDATQFRFMNAPAGWSSDWHPAAGRTVFFVISGEWEVTASDNDTRRFGKGDALLVEDTHGKGHKSQVTSKVDSLAAMIQLDK